MLIFDFEKMGQKGDKVTDEAIKAFKKEGLRLVKALTSVSPTKRTSGVSYKEITFVTDDNQKVQFSIKQSGDIFKVKIGVATDKVLKEVPVKNQSDHSLAIKEIAANLEKRRLQVQKQIERATKKMPTPPKLKSTVRTEINRLTDELNELNAAHEQADKRLAELRQGKI